MRRVRIRRSRSPIRSRGRGPLPSKQAITTVNELDRIALEKAKHLENSGSNASGGKIRERITCTIQTDGDREHGNDRRVSTGGGGTFDRKRLSGGRFSLPGVRDRLSFRGRGEFSGPHSNRFERPYAREREPTDKSSYDDEGKSVLKLVDPTHIPKGKGYFDHDDREKADAWRGRDKYDPRKDFGFGSSRGGIGNLRGRVGWSGFEGHRAATYRSFDRGGGFNRIRSDADDVWTHDKFFELEGVDPEEQEQEIKKYAPTPKPFRKFAQKVPTFTEMEKMKPKRTRSYSRSSADSRSRSRSVDKKKRREEKKDKHETDKNSDSEKITNDGEQAESVDEKNVDAKEKNNGNNIEKHNDERKGRDAKKETSSRRRHSSSSSSSSNTSSSSRSRSRDRKRDDRRGRNDRVKERDDRKGRDKTERYSSRRRSRSHSPYKSSSRRRR